MTDQNPNIPATLNDAALAEIRELTSETRELTERAREAAGSRADLDVVFGQIRDILGNLEALKTAPKPVEERRGFQMSEAKLAVIGPMFGAALIIAAQFLDGDVARWLGMLGVACGATLPAYPLARGLAKSGAAKAAPMVLAVIALGLLGGTACKGPGADTDYIRRDAIDDGVLMILERHDQWGGRLVELGELDRDRYLSNVRQAAVARHLFVEADPREPIALGAPEPDTGPPSAPPADAPSADPYDERDDLMEAASTDNSGGTLRR